MYKLPETLRSTLARPLAKVLTTEEAVAAAAGKYLVAVGDVCSAEFLAAGRAPDVIVADWKTQRVTDLAAFRARAAQDPTVWWLKVSNPAGVITSALWETIVNAVGATSGTRDGAPRKRALVEVDGEEDLAALPAILVAPEGSVVAYGQPNEGVVLVTVTPEARLLVRSILDRFEVVPDS